ncbi:MAG: replication initiator protein A [Lachnospiraceae bacterium]|nr:replication initiator protein A [Lachnospiraceae bacterium]
MSFEKRINYIKKNTKLPSYVPLPSSMIGTGLSSSAMILYAELLNRASLSQKNDMTDEFGNVYVIYPIDQLSKRLNLLLFSTLNDAPFFTLNGAVSA